MSFPSKSRNFFARGWETLALDGVEVSFLDKMESLEQRFEDFLNAHSLLQGGERLLLAVSGGVDSMTMLDLFERIAGRWHLSLAVAHVNHQLRGDESDGDEAFVRAQCERRSLPFYSTRVLTTSFAHERGFSKQVAARTLRYQFLSTIRDQIQADAVATAHQANDNAETVLMNSLRGAGVRGLAGIPLRDPQQRLIRPLLFAYRNEIDQYAVANSILFREDSSNASNDYRRNYLRNVAIPELEKNFDPGILAGLNSIAATFKSLRAELEMRVAEIYPSIVREQRDGEFHLDARLLLQQPESLRSELLLEVLRRVEIEPSTRKLEALLSLATKQSGRAIDLSKRWRAAANRDEVVLIPSAPQSDFSAQLAPGQTISTPSFQISATNIIPRNSGEWTASADVVFVNARALSKDLRIRSWREGDAFVPLGMHQRKKLSDFFIDQKIPVWKKHSIPIVESGSRIVWVCGLRLDDRFKLLPETDSVLKLSYHNFVS